MAKNQERVRELQIGAVVNKMMEHLGKESLGLSFSQQYEVHLRLAHELYGRAVDGWARLCLGLEGFRGEGEGI